jgi:hypothetical protein
MRYISISLPAIVALGGASVLLTPNAAVAQASQGVSLSAGKASPGLAPLPPLPEGVTELKFTEFFKTPVGPYGLEPTDKLKALQGKKVRIAGYMAIREKEVPGRFILAGAPVNIEDDEAGFADLPATHVWVFLPYAPDRAVPRVHRPLLLTGTLEIGNREEKGENAISFVRLSLDKPVSETAKKTTSLPSQKKPAHNEKTNSAGKPK